MTFELDKILEIRGNAVFIPKDNVDTDQIIPARFMKCVTFDGLGKYLFYDERFDAKGKEKQHPLNNKVRRSAKILLAGENFGCGSSREHAPQAIYRWGIRAIVAQSFAEIFYGNCLALGLPCLSISKKYLHRVAEVIKDDPSAELLVDISGKQLIYFNEMYPLNISESVRDAFLEGKWDDIVELQNGAKDVDEHLRKLEKA